MRKIHPAFKQFILNDAVKQWDKILKETEGQECGMNSGVCFQTSNAFCKVLDKDFGIPCELEMVETLIGNKQSEKIFLETLSTGKPDLLINAATKAMVEKGRENLTEKDPVLVGMGIGKEEDTFHFIMNLPEQKEIIDLTLARVDRPKWGIKCNNYWAKYDTRLGREYFTGEDVARRSNCVLFNTVKKTRGAVGLDAEKYLRAERELRSYLIEQVGKRKIPVFLR